MMHVNYGLRPRTLYLLLQIHLIIGIGGKDHVKITVEVITLEEGEQKVAAGLNKKRFLAVCKNDMIDFT